MTENKTHPTNEQPKVDWERYELPHNQSVWIAYDENSTVFEIKFPYPFPENKNITTNLQGGDKGSTTDMTMGESEAKTNELMKIWANGAKESHKIEHPSEPCSDCGCGAK